MGGVRDGLTNSPYGSGALTSPYGSGALTSLYGEGAVAQACCELRPAAAPGEQRLGDRSAAPNTPPHTPKTNSARPNSPAAARNASANRPTRSSVNRVLGPPKDSAATTAPLLPRTGTATADKPSSRSP